MNQSMKKMIGVWGFISFVIAIIFTFGLDIHINIWWNMINTSFYFIAFFMLIQYDLNQDKYKTKIINNWFMFNIIISIITITINSSISSTGSLQIFIAIFSFLLTIGSFFGESMCLMLFTILKKHLCFQNIKKR